MLDADPQESLGAMVASGRTVLVLFSAKWCTAGKVLDTQIRSSLALGVAYLYVDVDAEPHTADYHKIVSLPTAILFSKGEQTAKLYGSFSADEVGRETAKSLAVKTKGIA